MNGVLVSRLKALFNVRIPEALYRIYLRGRWMTTCCTMAPEQPSVMMQWMGRAVDHAAVVFEFHSPGMSCPLCECNDPPCVQTTRFIASFGK